MDAYRTWIGKSDTRRDIVGDAAAHGLSALLDREDEGRALPPLGHWLLFHSRARQAELGEDGHERRGGFLPPIALPRRMFAGARIVFHAPIAVGAEIVRVSTIDGIEEKAGRSGAMAFLRLRHEISAGGALALTEEQDIVYRAAPGANAPSPAGEADARPSAVTRQIAADTRLLFRYSALTYNAHRIHYDRDYATKAEGYPGLVVHGPLIATLLLDHFRRAEPAAVVRAFSFRAERPLFDTAPFDLCLARTPDGAALWARGPDGTRAMSATVQTA